MNGRFVRIDEMHRPDISISVDGARFLARADDTVLVAVLTNATELRESEFGDGRRAGFCLMGACQDCWMWTRKGERIRACTTAVSAGLDLLTIPPAEATWPSQA
ncbi:(2Fe-2S)-binding protein [Massilia cavernae]|uniref:(2Fe-2S)-binding protein n=1 Tax=Massilia cavernae TaxID=2320864 RepID=A0A418Y5X2_9BURK|nr:(2Fe-2S)-binding protein [Massilia cavernae]RJG22372.1 (2Fe-2S)-binding protein [Massilia cavernae]